MCWGIAVGDGWYTIIDALCETIQNYAESSGKIIEATQIKEKYGTLRFYTNQFDSFVAGMIRMAEELSGMTCETCGSTQNVTTEGSYILTLCESCRHLHNAKQIMEEE